MNGIRTAIELIDEMTGPLMDIVNSLNVTSSALENMQEVSTGTVDTSEIEAAREQVDQATAALVHMQEALGEIGSVGASVEVPSLLPSEPVTMPIEWQIPDNIDVFTNGGLARYEQEIASVNQMLSQVTANQQRIANLSSQTGVFPDNMITSLQTMDSRIQQLRSSILQIENNPINDIGAAAINNDLETLRNQLNQAIGLQNDLSAAMGRMDISAANTAYNRLVSVVDSTDIHIRENMNAQNQFNNSISQSSSMIDSLKGKIGTAMGLYASYRGAENVLNISDELSQTTARLNLMNDGLQTTQELQDMIYESAERSRASYTATAEIVANLGQRASDAFGTNAEAIQFAENLNKQFIIAGASQGEMASASLQLTQALGSGVLRGEELNAVFEAAPNVIQTIADYLEVPIGAIKEMASEGLITAEIMKSAMLGATGEINEQFEQIPITFENISTEIQSEALMAFQPLLQQLSQLANSEVFGQFVAMVTNMILILSGVVAEFINGTSFDGLATGIINALYVVGNVAIGVFDMLTGIAGFMIENWSMIAPILSGVVTALAAYAIYLGITNGLELISKGIKLASCLASYAHAAATGTEASANAIATASQYGLNAALLACPLTWIILAIIVIISVIYAVVAAITHFAETSLSATGIICGAFMVAAAIIGNVLVYLINYVIDIFVGIRNFIAAFANFFANVLNDPVGAIARLFFDLADTILSILQSIAGAIDTLFSKNLADSVQGWRDSLGGLVDDTFGQGVEVMAEIDAKDMHLGRFEYGAAWDLGNDFGEGVDQYIADAFTFKGLEDLGNEIDPYTDGLGSLISDNVQQIADNSAMIANSDAITMSKDDLEYLRTMAERTYMDKITVAEIKVEMNNQNSIKSDMDLDGIVEGLAYKLDETLAITAEGVYA